MEEWNQESIELAPSACRSSAGKKHIAAASIKAHLIPESGSLRGLGSRAGRVATLLGSPSWVEFELLVSDLLLPL